MKFKSFIGVDVSKLSLDICLITEDGEIKNFKIDNTLKALKIFFKRIDTSLNLPETLVCAEFTGHYSNILRGFCLDNEIALWLESGAEIKLRSGIQRSKSDKVDAERIADYALRYVDKARLQTLGDDAIAESKLLLTERDLYVKERAKYKAQLKDLGSFIKEKTFKDRSKRLKKHVS